MSAQDMPCPETPASEGEERKTPPPTDETLGLESLSIRDTTMCFDGVVTSVGPSFAIVNNDCYVPRHFVNILQLQVGHALRVTATPHAHGRNKWRARQVTPVGEPAVPGDIKREDLPPQTFFGEVTSTGNGFCIVRSDIFVPIALLHGLPVTERTMLRVDAIPRVSGRNRWRAVHAEIISAPQIPLQPDMHVHRDESSWPGLASIGDLAASLAPSAATGAPMHMGSLGVGTGQLRHIVGVVTSQGREFCIVNHDVYVPHHLVSGRRIIAGKTILRLAISPAQKGARNRWRAVSAFEVTSNPVENPGYYRAWDGVMPPGPVMPLGPPGHVLLPPGTPSHVVLPTAQPPVMMTGSMMMSPQVVMSAPGVVLPGPPPNIAPASKRDSREPQYDIVGPITSRGTTFAIINNDVYIPSHLLNGVRVSEGTIVRVRAVERRVGRNNWRAIAAMIEA